jgi:hypothetical protein
MYREPVSIRQSNNPIMACPSVPPGRALRCIFINGDWGSRNPPLIKDAASIPHAGIPLSSWYTYIYRCKISSVSSSVFLRHKEKYIENSSSIQQSKTNFIPQCCHCEEERRVISLSIQIPTINNEQWTINNEQRTIQKNNHAKLEPSCRFCCFLPFLHQIAF